MSVPILKQIHAMDSLSDRMDYEWREICRMQLTIVESLKIFKDIKDCKKYRCLSRSRQVTIQYLWFHIRKITLRNNQVYGYFYHGDFRDSWSLLPEEIRDDDDKLKRLPTGHFWKNPDGSVSTKRYFISGERVDEDYSHFENQSKE